MYSTSRATIHTVSTASRNSPAVQCRVVSAAKCASARPTVRIRPGRSITNTNVSTWTFSTSVKVRDTVGRRLTFVPFADFHYPPKMTLRILMTHGVINCLVQNRGPFDGDVPRAGYPAMLSLVEHEKDDKNDYSAASAMILAFILETRSEHEIISTGSIDRLSELTTKHIRQTNVNGTMPNSVPGG